jgi:hypothetical protein
VGQNVRSDDAVAIGSSNGNLRTVYFALT